MASKEELYVSLSPASYRRGKEIILTSQSHVLTTIKHLRNLKVLSRQKRDLKIKLNRLVNSALNEIEVLQDRLPHKRLPSSLDRKPKKLPKEKIIVDKKTEAKNSAIDKELRDIQEKLRKLNAAA